MLRSFSRVKSSLVFCGAGVLMAPASELNPAYSLDNECVLQKNGTESFPFTDRIVPLAFEQFGET